MTPTTRQHRPPPRVRARIGAGAQAPARARDALHTLRDQLGPNCLEKLELIVSELVTNAVRHSGAAHGAPIGLDVHCGADTIRVAVSDPGAGFGRSSEPRDPQKPGGWGLRLVAELADAWWVQPGSPTRVVAELER